MRKERETERKRAKRQKNKGNEFVHSSFDFEINGPFKNRMQKCRAFFQLKQAWSKECIVPQIFNLRPNLLKSIVHVIKFITNRKYGFYCTY